MSATQPVYKRILLKLSGEALMGDLDFGISPKVMGFVATELQSLVASGVEVALVVGGGNIFRGEGLARAGMDRVTGDQMGMLATVINALALQDAIERVGLQARVQSAIRINEVCEDFIRRRAIRHLEKGRVLVFGAGTGNPFFTTDSAAALRAVEIGADLMLKATKVDGIYTADPKTDPSAERYESLTFAEALEKRLQVMDTAAFAMCEDNGIPVVVFDFKKRGNIARVVTGEPIGTRVTTE